MLSCSKSFAKGCVSAVKKYQRVENWVKEGLKSGELKAGDLLPSEAEICALFSVGRNSVRTALNNLSHAGYVETKKGIGTFCRSGNKPAITNIGFICFFAHSYIFPRMVAGCEEVLYRNGYHLLLNQSEFNLEKEREVLEKLRKNKVAGIVIEPVFSGRGESNADLLHDFEAAGIPVVLIDNYFPAEEFSSIAMDDQLGGRLMAQHLIERGHRDIGILYKENYYPKVLRKEGSYDYLAERNVDVPEEWLVGYAGPPSPGQIYAAADRLLADPMRRPTAVICTSDEESVELINAAEARGLTLPEELSIVSFDNSSLAQLPRLSLTSINHPSHYIGSIAATMLLERVGHPEVQSYSSVRIRPELVERTSVKQLDSVRL